MIIQHPETQPMNPPPTLSTAPLEHPALDYARLRQEGIDLLQRLAGAQWSDFNTHDPGVTLLEQLCYALTDLAHRIEYNMPDLLARAGQTSLAQRFGPREMLTTHPVTLTDLRKLVIDVEGVSNGWVALSTDETVYATKSDQDDRAIWPTPYAPTPPDATPIPLRGLYAVDVELAPGQDEAAVKAAVTRTLHAHRGLCEDVGPVRVLQAQLVRINATIEIGRVADPHGLLLDICLRVAEHISPTIRRYGSGRTAGRGQVCGRTLRRSPAPERLYRRRRA